MNVGFSFLDTPESVRTFFNIFTHRKFLRDEIDDEPNLEQSQTNPPIDAEADVFIPEDLHTLTQTRAHTHTHAPAWTHPSTPSTHIQISYHTASPKQHFSSELREHMRVRTQTRTHNQIADHEEQRNKVLLGMSLRVGV
jgi:hypothetical protein